MTRRPFVIACCLLLCTALPLGAQSGRGTKNDPITGTWTGELTPDGGQPPPKQVTLELKFDGKRGVTGTFTGLPSPGDVKKGTFDPKTGALALELGKEGESAVRLVLEGSVAKGVATGKITGEATGTFKLTRKP